MSAKVYVDEKLVGTTPMQMDGVDAGPHVVRLELDGYQRLVVIGPGRLWRASQSVSVAREMSQSTMEAVLALEDGTVFRGLATGAEGETHGEVVFNTSMTGYQEVLTDPSYSGQIVAMTCAEIGNYGVSPEDVESRRPQVAGFIIRDESPVASNWRAAGTLRDYLVANNIVAISDIDTRALTRLLRSAGVMRGVIATGNALDPQALVAQAQASPQDGRVGSGEGCHVASRRSTGRRKIRASSASTPDRRAKRRLKIAAYDFGMKWNIMRRLSAHGCDVRVYPASTPAAELLATSPDGVFLSNGPGDPAPLTYAIENAATLVAVERAGLRHLPRPPDSRPRDGRHDLQAEVRPSRRATIR